MIMKRLSLIFTVVFGLFLCVNAHAQVKTDYFAGKWNVTVIGTPNGDRNIIFAFTRTDGKLTGAVQDTTGVETAKITSIEENEKSLTAAFTAEGYDVTVTFEPVDDDNIKGSLMGMFDAKGVRVKEEK